jgi:hypothetical protein
MILSQRIRISTLAQSPELARALHVVCRAIMQVSIQDLTQAGYTAVEFDGTDELSVEEMLAAEEMGIYVRHQTWSAMSQVEIRGWTATAATKPWFVLGNHNTTSTGESGGVKIMTTS